MQDMQELRKIIRQRLMNDYDILMEDSIDEEKLCHYIDQIAQSLPMKDRELLQNEEIKASLAKAIIDNIAGLGPLKGLIDDPEITEIMVNGSRKIFIERKGKMELAPLSFDSDRDVLNVIHKIMAPTQRRVDESNPYVDLSLPDGSRVNIILPPLALDGPSITIRKFSRELNIIEDLVNAHTLTQDMAAFLIAAIKAKLNIIFSGATGAGKTTTLNILSNYIPDDERIVTIEDTAELRLNQENVVRLETRSANVEGKGVVSIRELFINSLRMRPDRIILGEIRSHEVLDMLQSISSGHGGTMAIVHGNSPESVISRIETMIALSLIALPLAVTRKQIVSALDIIVHHDQLADGSRKITHISEVRDIKNDEVVLEDLFWFETEDKLVDDIVAGIWRKSACVPRFINKIKKVNEQLNENFFKKAY